jgi:preprotein translocase subunit SecA
MVDATRPGTLAAYQGLVAKAGADQARIEKLTDEELTAAAIALRDRAGGGWSDRDRVEWCGLGREAARRTVDMRPFDVQLLGTLAMLSGSVVQMATGEGKTLVGALVAAGYATQGHQVHVISVNDYLAQRDAEWMGPLYALLGVSVGWLSQHSTPEQRRAAYAADVTYVSVSEVGFDVLRDRMATDVADVIVPEPDVAVVDEVDSVLVDEATIPLVLAGAVAGDESDRAITKIVGSLRVEEHYEIDEEGRNVFLTEAGADVIEQALGGIDLYAAEAGATLAQVNVSLHAHALLRRDVDYLVKDGKVALINSSRGRVASLQRWPDGLQAAVELKEQVKVSEGGEVLDQMTVQSLLRRYKTLCGMSGTAAQVVENLQEFYQLGVRTADPNVPCVREDEPDRVYATVPQKDEAIVDYIADRHEEGRPVLVGTLDVAESERLAKRLARRGLSCVVLNARNDASEAAIVAEAGAYGAITVSTQMAGRGTDIRLGGTENSQEEHDRVAEAGGLAVIGTGRHSSSRLDDQLRGRAGRQGDPGSSVFFASIEDEIVQHYAPETEPAQEEETDEYGRLTTKRAQADLRHAQKVAEAVQLEIHRNTWRYNQLAEQQRTILLRHRGKLLTSDAALSELKERCPDRYEELGKEVSEETLVKAARLIALFHVDRCWVDHLAFLADIRETIHLQALAREDPLTEFHRLSIPAFKELVSDAWERSAKTFETANITEAHGLDLADAGLKRPNTTWTYLVQDNPFGNEDDRTIRHVAALLRKRRNKF